MEPDDTRSSLCRPVLLVDDDPAFLLSSQVTLRSSGISPVETINDSRHVLPFLSEREASIVVLDLTMPHIGGTEILEKIKAEFPHIPVIVSTAQCEVDVAVTCMKGGAFDYLVKPMESSRFVSSVSRALELHGLRQEVSSLKKSLLSSRLEDEAAFAEILTRSGKMRAIFRYVEAIAPSGQPVLVTGETGVGKELIAKAVHDRSGCKGAFVPVNAAGLDDTMFSDTLFGHKKGAYTGADQAREGLIACAAGGTLFLDEVGDMKVSSQVKLLRLLEQRTYYPLGSDVQKRSDARIICATDKDLKARMVEGTYRKDLYYRLAAHHIHIPTLRERPEDLPLLVGLFLKDSASTMRKRAPSIPQELFLLLSTYSFPGNVRELKTMVANAVAQHTTGVLSIESFRKKIEEERAHAGSSPLPVPGNGNVPFPIPERFPTLKDTERYLIAEALERSGNNQGVAASLLGISRQALNKRLVRMERSEGSRHKG
ncbi:MAG: sigma-54-dependent Fis family transcriptional regulator [Deltaproteobacteria bacterium]|nr:sigma-54-dependent Fis family transcriptional regulator [Deltaproteobacteria bacterium]